MLSLLVNFFDVTKPLNSIYTHPDAPLNKTWSKYLCNIFIKKIVGIVVTSHNFFRKSFDFINIVTIGIFFCIISR